jgi:hypothetical protein
MQVSRLGCLRWVKYNGMVAREPVWWAASCLLCKTKTRIHSHVAHPLETAIHERRSRRASYIIAGAGIKEGRTLISILHSETLKTYKWNSGVGA